MQFKTIIFDCDGVLIDSEIIANRIEVEVKTELGFPITLEEQLRKFVGLGMTHPHVQSELLRLPANYLQIVDDRVKVAYADELKPIDGVVWVLENIKIPKCIASSSEPEWLSLKLSLTQLIHYFPNAIFNGRMVKSCKPAPDLFLLALEKMGWDAASCLVIEDSVAGVQAGKAAGLTVCGFTGAAHAYAGHAERLSAVGADHIISDIKQIQNFI